MNATQRHETIRAALRKSEMALADALRMIQDASNLVPDEPDKPPEPMMITASEIAAIIGRSARTIVDSTSEIPGFPRPATRRPKTWRRDAVLEWIRTHKGRFIGK